MYPQVLSYSDNVAKKEKLQDIVSGQLYRDILEFQDIKNPDILIKLLELLAIRIGSEVSYHALAQLLGVSQQTVERYIDLLEKSFVIFRLRPYMTNKSKEVTKMKKNFLWAFLCLISTTTLLAQQTKTENSLLWKVTGNGLKKPSYLFGTYHFLSSGFIDPMQAVKSAYKSTEAVVGELIIDTTIQGPMM